MMRALALVLAVLLWLAVAAGAEGTVSGGTVAELPTYCVCEGEAPEGEESIPPGDQIYIKNDTMEINVTQATWVSHGQATVTVKNTAGMSAAELCSFLHAHCLFELTVDGTRVGANYIDAGQWTDPHGVNCWVISWNFEFPGGYFAPGIHILEGRWTITELPCEYFSPGCESPVVPDSLFTVEHPYTFEGGVVNVVVSHILTLSVLYP